MRKLAILLALLWVGPALAQDPSKTSYFQLTQTPNYLANGGPGFVQIDVNGHPFIAASVPGSGTVTNSANLANNAMVVGDGGGAGIKTVGGSIGGSFTTAGNFALTGAASGSTFALPAGGPFTFTYPLATSTLASLAGVETFTNKTYSGGVLSGTFSGTPTYSGVPKFTGLSAGTQVSCMGLDSGNNLVLLLAGCSAGGGGLTVGTSTITSGTNGRFLYDNSGVLGEAIIGSGLSFSGGTLSATGGGATTGFGVDGGTNPQTISNPAAGAATINNNAEQINIASLNAATTLTLPAISAIPSPTTGCIRLHDKGQVGATNTLTIKGGVSDGLNNGAANGTIGPFTTPNLFLMACVSGANNWNVGPGSIAASSAPSNQFANGVTINGLSYAQPSYSNLSGTATGQIIPTDGGSHSYTVLTTDLNNEISLVSTFTALVVPQATGSFGAATQFIVCNSGPVTATSTTSTINGIAGATGIKLGALSCSRWFSSGGQWIVQAGVPTDPTQRSTAYLAGDGSYSVPAGGGTTVTIASGASALGTSAIASAACASVVTAAATGTATTDVVTASFNGDPTAVTGYVPLTTGMLTIIVYPTTNNVNFKVCNNTNASITPGAITLNWRVVR